MFELTNHPKPQRRAPSPRKLSIIGAAVAAIALLAPASVLAERIGPRLPYERYSLTGLSDFYTWTGVQVRLAGKPMTAPFTGTIKSFRVQGAYGGPYRLQVLRKDDNGWRVIREASGACTRRCNADDVVSFDTHLKIRAGDFIGLWAMGPETYWGFSDRRDSRSRRVSFDPGLEQGMPTQPTNSRSHSVLLYNARLVR
jgi:hypothetical protein